MLAHEDPSQVEGLSRFFKTGKGQYGEGDKFLGIKVPVTREVVKQCWQETSFNDLETCIRSEYHEMRLAALLTLVQIFKHAKKDIDLQQRCINFYLSHTEFINNWDLVDLSCYELLGVWLLDKERTLLYDLARNGKSLWEQRIGIVSTMQFLRHGQLEDTYAIAEIFLDKPMPLHDLLIRLWVISIVFGVKISSVTYLQNSASLIPSRKVSCGVILVTIMAAGLGKASLVILTRTFTGSPIGSKSSVVRCPANCIILSSRGSSPDVSKS